MFGFWIILFCYVKTSQIASENEDFIKSVLHHAWYLRCSAEMISFHRHTFLFPLFIRLINLLVLVNVRIPRLIRYYQCFKSYASWHRAHQMHFAKLSCYVVNLIPFCSLLERVLSHVNFLPLKCTLNISKTYKTRGAIELQLNRNFCNTHTHIFHRDKLFLSLVFVF